MRAQYGDMIGGCFRVRRPYPDIDQRDPSPICGPQMIGGHLEPTPRRTINQLARILGVGTDGQGTGNRKLSIAAIRLQLLQLPIDEGIDMAVLIGEQQIALKMRHRRAGIMLQTLQREVGPQGIKQSQRPVIIGFIELAIRNLVANIAQERGGKPFGQLGRADLV